MALRTWLQIAAVFGTSLAAARSLCAGLAGARTLFELHYLFLLILIPGYLLELHRGSTAALAPPKLAQLPPPPAFVDRRLLQRPSIAWPTLWLAAGSVGGFWGSVYLGHRSTSCAQSAAAFVLGSACGFAAFTPMHEAAHGSAAPRHRYLNSLVGHLSSSCFLGMYRTFRMIHLLHHRHTNDLSGAPDGSSLDPDHWAGEGPPALLPLRWATVYFYYLYYAVQCEDWEMRWGRARLGKTCYGPVFLELLPSLLTAYALWAALGSGVWALYVAPFMTSSMYLMYVFDYVPHRPHLVPRAHSQFAATHVALAPFGLSENWFTAGMLMQNYHNIHHLFPALPFYRYPSVYKPYRDEFAKRGTHELPFFTSPQALVHINCEDG